MSDFFVKVGEDTVWPNPHAILDLAWTLRNTEAPLSREERSVLASVVSAYRHLVSKDMTAQRRNEVCRALRAAEDGCRCGCHGVGCSAGQLLAVAKAAP